MKIAIAGGTGLIGRSLTKLLKNEGHEIIILSREKKENRDGVLFVQWLNDSAKPEKQLEKIDAIINLAGVSINDGRWTSNHKKKIYESRITATKEVQRIIAKLPEKPSIWINASAIGIYPPSLAAEYSENSREKADHFLGKTVQAWEQEARKVENIGIRTVLMRFGVVLSNNGGAFPLMVLPYKLFVGGRIGSGKQWVSWVHETDVARAIQFALKKDKVSGPVNVTAPNPVRMNEFGKTAGLVLKRPHWFPVPSFAMRLALGEKSSLVLEGQKVLPTVLMENGFQFRFPDLKHALEDLLVK